MGGADAVLKQAKQSIAKGDYRWATEQFDNLLGMFNIVLP
jgi:alkyl sulfatase BDS1-like metallo-beta-lactamase superfamily hydrolase